MAWAANPAWDEAHPGASRPEGDWLPSYRIRRVVNGKRRDGTPYLAFALTVPPGIARQLAKDLEFKCELTNDGILYRPVERRPGAELPPWASG